MFLPMSSYRIIVPEECYSETLRRVALHSVDTRKGNLDLPD